MDVGINSKMKSIRAIFLLLTVIGCAGQDKTDQVKNGQVVTEYTPLEGVFGAYISSDYLEELRKHGSTKLAQEKAVMSTATIENVDNGYYFASTWGFHEGSDSNRILMISGSKGVCVNSEGDTLYHLDFSIQNELLVTGDNQKYHLIKFSTDTKNADFHEPINRLLLNDKFESGNGIIEFTREGKVIGLDSIKSYSFNLDYNDAGMEYDMIYLTNKDDVVKYYSYSFQADSLLIFNLNCEKSLEEYPDNCVVHSMGDAVIKMKKIKN